MMKGIGGITNLCSPRDKIWSCAQNLNRCKIYNANIRSEAIMRIVDFAIERYARRQFVDAVPMQKRAVE